jgi:hypothetical protein
MQCINATSMQVGAPAMSMQIFPANLVLPSTRSHALPSIRMALVNSSIRSTRVTVAATGRQHPADSSNEKGELFGG